MQIPKPCFLLYFLPFHWIFLLNHVPFRHLLYESATFSFSFRANPKEINLAGEQNLSYFDQSVAYGCTSMLYYSILIGLKIKIIIDK